MDYALFTDTLSKAVSELGLLIDKAGLKTIARAMSDTDPAAAPLPKTSRNLSPSSKRAADYLPHS